MKNSITKDSHIIPEGITLKLAILDYLPVAFFGAALIIASQFFHSPLILIGGILCTLAGTLKATWKVIVACRKRNIYPMNLLFRYLMPAGFLLILIGSILVLTSRSLTSMVHFVSQSPARWALLVCIVFLAGMVLCFFLLDSSMRRSHVIEQSINSVAQFALLFAVIWLSYTGNYYHASKEATASIHTAQEEITITQEGDSYIFAPKDSAKLQAGLLFYPGGLVQCEAYAPLMEACAKEGILCVLMKMPDNLAILDIHASDGILARYPDIHHWYLGGHSLGGATASMYIANHAAEYDGLILLGAYSTSNLTKTDLKVTLLYGSKDQVLNHSSYEKNRKNLPDGYVETVIEGGCHAYFGDYGAQAGDGIPTISRQQQLQITVDEILQTIKR